MIRTENLRYTVPFAGRELLRDISLHIMPGEFVSILGPNGAGKTTLLKCLLGLLPYSGSVLLNNEEVIKNSRKKIAMNVAYIPQVTDAMPSYTVKEFVFMGRHVHLESVFDSGIEHYERVDWALAKTACQELSERALCSLSGGERQRVFLAAALAQDTPLILMDEPGAFLDPQHEAMLYRLLSKLQKEQKKTLVMVSHDCNRSVLTSERIIALKDGRLVFDGASQEFLEENRLASIYGRDFCLVSHPESGTAMMLPKH